MREHWYLAPLTLAASCLQFEIGMSRNVILLFQSDVLVTELLSTLFFRKYEKLNF